jgi:hypothetical protein
VFDAFVTGYTYYSNTPPGSAVVSHPVVRRTAGGRGTWADPITLAVGHSLATGRDVLDYPAGTRFYLPYLKRYFIVEDTCGDGPEPEKGPCHVNDNGDEPWLDIWLGGEGLGEARTVECAEAITGVRKVIQNPRADLPVVTGFICD